MPGVGPGELILILVISLLVLGPKRLPEAGRALGKGMREFKESMSGADPRPELENLTATDTKRSAERAFGDEAP